VVPADSAPLLIRLLFVFLIVPMIWVDQVGEFPEFIFEMSYLNLRIMEMGVLQLIAQVGKGMLDFLFEAAMPVTCLVAFCPAGSVLVFGHDVG
jgi:hypothetical protein